MQRFGGVLPFSFLDRCDERGYRRSCFYTFSFASTCTGCWLPQLVVLFQFHPRAWCVPRCWLEWKDYPRRRWDGDLGASVIRVCVIFITKLVLALTSRGLRPAWYQRCRRSTDQKKCEGLRSVCRLSD